MKKFITLLFLLVFANAILGQVKKATPKPKTKSQTIRTSISSQTASQTKGKADEVILQAKQAYLEGVNFLTDKKPVLARASFDASAIELGGGGFPVSNKYIES